MARYNTFRYGSGIRYGIQELTGNDVVINFAYPVANVSFARMKFNLVDEHIYDKEDIVSGFYGIPHEFTGVCGPNLQVSLYLNDNLVGETTSAADGSFSFFLRLKLGENKIRTSAVPVVDVVYSNILYINTYNLYLWLEAYGDEFLRLWNEWNRIKNNLYIRTADAQGLRDNFAQYTDVTLLPIFSIEEYRRKIHVALSAYLESTVWLSFRNVVYEFVGEYPTLIEYFTKPWFRTDNDAKVWASTSTLPLNANWTVGQRYINNRWGFILAGTIVVIDNATSAIYVDGSKDPDGYLTVKNDLLVDVPDGAVVLGVVTATSGTIASITGCGRSGNLPETGLNAIGRSVLGKGNKFEVYCKGTGIASELKTMVVNILKNVRPAHKVCYLKFDDESYARIV